MPKREPKKFFVIVQDKEYEVSLEKKLWSQQHGEENLVFKDGEIVAHAGSWLVGGPTEPGAPVDTATATEPAVFFPGDPDIGDQWKPEDLFPVVDETVTLQAEGLSVSVPAGDYTVALTCQSLDDMPDQDDEIAFLQSRNVVVMAELNTEVNFIQ